MKCADREILVTGAGGFIGSHLVEELVKRGNKVRALVRYTSMANLGLLVYLPDRNRPSYFHRRSGPHDLYP
jgi:nucleoside-diphosphate-sugar epimerase